MSFILDALRKSEHARGGRALPGLVDLPLSRTTPSRLPLVLGVLGALLLVNLVVLGVVLWRPSSPAAAAPVAVPAAPTPRALAPSPVARERTRPLDEEAGDSAIDGDGSEPVASARTAAAPVAARHVARAATGGPPPADVPTLNDLPAESASGLPHLNIDLHVWSNDARERFVVLNGQRVHEGAQLREGPTLERITPDGVVLLYHGTHFSLPRQ